MSLFDRDFKVGDAVAHYKGRKYIIVALAKHVDGGDLIVYRDLYMPEKVWARTKQEFTSTVTIDEGTSKMRVLYRFERE